MTHYYAEHGFGLFLSDEDSESDIFLDKCRALNNLDSDCLDLLDGICGFTDAVYYNEDNAADRYFAAINNTDSKEGVSGIFFFANHQPNAFKCAYKDIDEVISEFKTKIGRYLPGDFDWKSHIGNFQCCTCA